jgi:hypothetical protein
LIWDQANAYLKSESSENLASSFSFQNSASKLEDHGTAVDGASGNHISSDEEYFQIVLKQCKQKTYISIMQNIKQ